MKIIPLKNILKHITTIANRALYRPTSCNTLSQAFRTTTDPYPNPTKERVDLSLQSLFTVQS
jgi:hypothetical protein